MNILDMIQMAGAQGQPTFGGGSMGNPPNVLSMAPSEEPEVVVRAEPRRQVLEDDRMEPGPRRTDELIPRKGMFGVKGTLRDVLGLVGDSLLIGGGGKAFYQPHREQEKLGSAIYGYNDDPQAAIDRAAIVNPEAAIELQQRYDQGRRIDSQISAQKLTGQQKAAEIAGSWARTLTPETYALARPKLQAYADKYELGYNLPEAYDENVLSGIFNRGLTPDQYADNERDALSDRSQEEYRKEQIGLGRDRVGEQRRHNTASETIARQRAAASGKSNSRATASNVDAVVLQAVQDGTANPAQLRYFEQRLKRGTTGKPSLIDRLRGGSSGGPPPPPNGGSFRKVK